MKEYGAPRSLGSRTSFLLPTHPFNFLKFNSVFNETVEVRAVDDEMWKFLKLTLLAAAVETGGSSASGAQPRFRGSPIALIDGAHEIVALPWQRQAKVFVNRLPTGSPVMPRPA